MLGRYWFMEDWRTLLEGHREQFERAQRELGAAVKLVRNQGADWHDFARALKLTDDEARTRYGAGTTG